MLLPCLVGCFHFPNPRRAPGHADIPNPPVAIESTETEAAEDPGERIVRLDTDGLLLFGPTPSSDGLATSTSLGTEMALTFGVSDKRTDVPFPPRPAGWGFAVGLSHLRGDFSSPDGSIVSGTWAATGEIRRTVLHALSVGLGWAAWSTGRRGPEGSADLSPFFLRWGHLIGDGGYCLFGLRLGPSFTWASPR
jgi:hypothetical protein